MFWRRSELTFGSIGVTPPPLAFFVIRSLFMRSKYDVETGACLRRYLIRDIAKELSSREGNRVKEQGVQWLETESWKGIGNSKAILLSASSDSA